MLLISTSCTRQARTSPKLVIVILSKNICIFEVHSVDKVKRRIYIDTSVFGEYFDEEFRDHTIPLFNRINNSEFIVLYSTVTQSELENVHVEIGTSNISLTSREFEVTTR